MEGNEGLKLKLEVLCGSRTCVVVVVVVVVTIEVKVGPRDHP